ncbi:GAG-binding domain-containing protein [Capnocytophaga sputigena]|uniref:GAG-binding domain-containing protein n=1 Tax=Capnocytophaga sputigena TaxID=1019 RepID=UPI0028ED1E5E|nr:GAG-binding domain-containing protein [Capnocytophaga sputigena]
MKHYFIFTVIALAISFATGCKKDDSTPENTKKEAIHHKENIAYYKTDVNDVSAYKGLIEQTITEYNTLLAAVDKLPQYPKDKYKYARQDYAWAEGKRISNELLQNYNNKKSNIDVALAKKTYEDLYQYGVVYAHIELMARQAEVYRNEYPTNAEIENLIKATFDGLYTTQEGNDHFIKSTNEEIVANYNKIIDIVNKLKSQQ